MIDATALRYALVGVANTVVGLGCILLLQYGFDLLPAVANAFGFALGLLLSYFLNRRFAFRSQRAHVAAVPFFLLAAAASYLLNLLVLHVGLVRLSLNGVVAQAVAVLSYAVSFYLLNRYVVFTRIRS